MSKRLANPNYKGTRKDWQLPLNSPESWGRVSKPLETDPFRGVLNTPARKPTTVLHVSPKLPAPGPRSAKRPWQSKLLACTRVEPCWATLLRGGKPCFIHFEVRLVAICSQTHVSLELAADVNVPHSASSGNKKMRQSFPRQSSRFQSPRTLAEAAEAHRWAPSHRSSMERLLAGSRQMPARCSQLPLEKKI